MRRNILFQHETVFDRFELVPEGERGQMIAEKCEPSVSEFEAFDNDIDNNDTRAPGHENEYLLLTRAVQPCYLDCRILQLQRTTSIN